jgi:hypothetical protein
MCLNYGSLGSSNITDNVSLKNVVSSFTNSGKVRPSAGSSPSDKGIRVVELELEKLFY